MYHDAILQTNVAPCLFLCVLVAGAAGLHSTSQHRFVWAITAAVVFRNIIVLLSRLLVSELLVTSGTRDRRILVMLLVMVVEVFSAEKSSAKMDPANVIVTKSLPLISAHGLMKAPRALQPSERTEGRFGGVKGLVPLAETNVGINPYLA